MKLNQMFRHMCIWLWPKLSKTRIVVDNRSDVPEELVVTASLACQLVLDKLLDPTQRIAPVKLIFLSTIMSQDNIDLSIACEAFPDGNTIVFAMESQGMEKWYKFAGNIGAMLLLSAHSAAFVAQIRTGHPMMCESDPFHNEDRAWNESLDLFKALRPYTTGQIVVGGRTYFVPNESTYLVNIDDLPEYIS
jgi:hypothetical protein